MSAPEILDIGVMVSGRGTNLQAIIHAVNSKKIHASIKIVISNRPDVLALKRASEAGIPNYVIEPRFFGKWPACKGAYEKKVVGLLMEHKIQLLVLAGYDRLVGPDILQAFPMRVINIHPALLPAFPGLHAQRAALEYGAKVSGATVFFVDDSIDGGPIILQESCPVMDDDTEESLSQRILEIEHRILPKAIDLIARKKVEIQGRRVRILD